MAYSGSTSTTPNMPALVTQSIAYASSAVTGSTDAIGRGQPRTWIYQSTHLNADVTAVNFFGADSLKLGLKVGDIIMNYSSSNVTSHRVTVIGSTTSQLSTGVIVANA